MNSIVDEWLEKAEGDFRTTEREARVRKAPNYDAVCFHAQQCAEKYLKAFLTQRQIPFRPIHDLEVLLNLVIPVSPDLELARDLFLLLNDYAVDVRYPGESATKEEARAAVKAVRTVRALIQQKLGITDQSV
jgi:HEPN domain-containing protein